MTDYQIAVRTFEMLDVPADEATIRRMVGRYEALLPEELPKKQGRVLPNVREILEHLRGRPDVRSYLLTGNTRGGARAKLTHYDLFQYFLGRRVCRRRGRSRDASPRGRSTWRVRAGPVADDGVFVVGDTPHDIDCANAIGARTVAVATGGYSLDELDVPSAVAGVRRAAAAEEFARLIDEDAAAMKHGIRRFPQLWRATRLARRWYHARAGAPIPDWRQLIAADSERWQSARAAAAGGPRVLMATAIGSYAHAVTLESALAAALTFRGAEVHVLLCDGAMTACAECEASLYPELARFVEHGPSRDLCRDCQWPAERVYAQLGLKVHRYSDWLTAEDRAEARRIATTLPSDQIERFTLDGLAIGEHALRRCAAVLCHRLAGR